MIDAISEFEPDKRILAVKNITRESDIMEHHFPGFSVMPGAMSLEAMAQAAGLLLLRSEMEARGRLFAAALVTVTRARFQHPVFPGDQLSITATLSRRDANAAQFDTHACVVEKRVASARMTLACRELDRIRHPRTAAFVETLLSEYSAQREWLT